MELKVNLAGLILRISGDDEQMFREPGILSSFVTDDENVHREVKCAVADSFPEPVGRYIYNDSGRWVYRDGDAEISYIGTVGDSPDQAYVWAKRLPDVTEILVKRSAVLSCIQPITVLYALELEHLLAEKQGILFHCSYIRYQDEAILFTAPSGVGKSTQADLWHKFRGAQVINGDRAAIRVEEGNVEAWGIPFCGSSGIRHFCRLPLKAVVCLSQAPETSIRRLGGVKAFRQIWEGCSLHTWDKEDVSRSSETVLQIVRQIPVFALDCTPDESAVLALEQALNQIQR